MMEGGYLFMNECTEGDGDDGINSTSRNSSNRISGGK